MAKFYESLTCPDPGYQNSLFPSNPPRKENVPDLNVLFDNEKKELQVCLGNYVYPIDPQTDIEIQPPTHNVPIILDQSSSDSFSSHEDCTSIQHLSDDGAECYNDYRPAARGKRLWEFLEQMLSDAHCKLNVIRWEDERQGIFRIVDSKNLATLWGQQKNNNSMNYSKLSRALRHYYKKGILERIPGKRLTYKFCEKFRLRKKSARVIDALSHQTFVPNISEEYAIIDTNTWPDFLTNFLC